MPQPLRRGFVNEAGAGATRHWRAPQADGEALVAPLPASAALGENLASRRDWTFQIAGLPLAEFAGSARKELLLLAARFSQLPPPANPTGPLLLSGHQPTLFHPGVWFKNFLLANLAASQSANAVNLIVDNDLCPPATIAVPTRLDGAPTVVHEPFAQPAPRIPFEERLLRERELLRTFPERVQAHLQYFPEAYRASPPLIASFPDLSAWRAAVLPAAPPEPLGLTLAAIRRELEQRAGVTNLELPLSQLAQTTAFRSFSLSLLADLPRFAASYNAALAAYRRQNRIRSKAHPAPDLETQGGWLEAPLWIWTTENPTRRRLFVRTSPNRMEWTDLQGWRAELPTPDSLHDDRFQRQWAALEAAGVKLRPRALLTTLYSRLVLCDLFIHGIGGAKYDEVTDALLSSYFGITPPHYLTATATLRLPIERPQVSALTLSNYRAIDRSYRYHPERLSALATGELRSEFAELAGEKNRLLDQIGGPSQRANREQQARLRQLNARLAELLTPHRQWHARAVARMTAERQLGLLLGSREFSFCLFPQPTLIEKLQSLCSV